MGAPQLIVPGTASGTTPVGGTGTTNTIPRWTGPSTLGDSALVQSGTNAVGFGTPKTWGTNFTLNAIQLSESASLSADINTTYLAANQYWDSPGFQNRRIKANFAARYLLNGASGDHQFQIAPFGAADSGITWSTAMTILNTSGNVGIGWASPTAKLHVTQGSSPNFANLLIGSAGTSTNFYDANEHYFRNGSLATGMYISSVGNVGIGTASPVSRLDVAGTITCDDAGTGLKLPATPGNADTQTLDCYAEGTWTPTLAGFGGTNPTVTASYTRVGRLVTIAVQIDATGGNQYSMTLGTTTITTPAGMTANSICAAPVVDGGVANRGIASVWTTGIIYLPTVALTTASTFFVATYRV